MECGRLSAGLWMSRHIFKVWLQLISLPVEVHLSVVGGVKRGVRGQRINSCDRANVQNCDFDSSTSSSPTPRTAH